MQTLSVERDDKGRYEKWSSELMRAMALHRELVRRERSRAGTVILDRTSAVVARHALGLSIPKLARLAQMSSASIWRIENPMPDREPTVATRKKLRAFYEEKFEITFVKSATQVGVMWDSKP